MARIPFIVSNIVALIFLSFGVNALLRPHSALSFLPLPFPSHASSEVTVNALIYLYGVRDIFMGLAVEAGALFGSRRVLGLILLAGASVAIADGFIVKNATPGEGNEWSHWGYVPFLPRDYYFAYLRAPQRCPKTHANAPKLLTIAVGNRGCVDSRMMKGGGQRD